MKIAIIGYGKMGKTIERIALEMGHEIVLKIDLENRSDFSKGSLKKADVAIEFSRPESAFENIGGCLRAGVPVISGTTGWLDKMEAAKQICRETNGAFFYASNYSIGVNIFFALSNQLAKMMDAFPSYEVQLEEIHHTQKLDAPSGTAISLAEGILNNLTRKERWINEPERLPSDLSILSKRIDKVPGTHLVTYSSAIDTIEIKHAAHSREGFASGAVMAAEWIVGKKGFFGMEDLLGF